MWKCFVTIVRAEYPIPDNNHNQVDLNKILSHKTSGIYFAASSALLSCAEYKLTIEIF